MKEVRAALRRRILAGVLVALTLSLAGNWIMEPQPTAIVTAPVLVDANSVARQTGNKRTPHFLSSDPTLHLARLESTEHNWYSGTGRNIFWAYLKDETKKAPPKPKRDKLESGTRQPKNETSLKFFGYVLMGNVPKKVFLRDDDALFVAREGDLIDRRYKVIKVEENSLDVEDLVEHRTLTIELQG